VSDLALFPEADAYNGDPIHPDTDVPTPASIVATLTKPDREQRVRHLVQQAHNIYDEALATHLGNRDVAASCVLFSGGNDSTTLAHLFRHRATHAIHANTTIGAEETRQYVRNTCAAWGLTLVEETPDDTYEDLVLGRVRTQAGAIVWPGGFPGPGAHTFIYSRIKERGLDKARHTIEFANSHKQAGVFIAGRRRLESERRTDIPLHEPDGTVIWVSPIANWSKLDMNTYRLMHEGTDNPVPRNWVADLMHMSMECLCGAYAHPGELDEIRHHFPHIATEIEHLQQLVLAEIAAGRLSIDPAFAVWGHGLGKPSGSGRLCTSCDDRFQLALEIPA
jgi:3'-phosphoadenosine 5'-phosphosulfate sulfotransferase (PAPS reductase)/FAD synthetase